jgi:hypothetical protein
MNRRLLWLPVWAGLIVQALTAVRGGETRHVWEKVEIKLEAQRQYENPYTDVEVARRDIGQVWRKYLGAKAEKMKTQTYP